MHTSTGKLVYDPFRGDLFSSNWCVLEVDTELTRYYRWWLEYTQHVHLAPPSWDAHISVVRGERISHEKREMWKTRHNHKIDFMYHPVSDFKRVVDKDRGGFFYVVDVYSLELSEVRAELGLRTWFSYHLTFGRTHEYQARVPKRPIKK